MGIRGTVRRSTDGDFIHSNIDIDLLIDEEREIGKDLKPKELFHIVERFCQGKRRLVSNIKNPQPNSLKLYLAFIRPGR